MERDWHNGDSDGQHIQAQGTIPDPYSFPGFEEVASQRQHPTRLKGVDKGGKELRVRTGYDFEGD